MDKRRFIELWDRHCNADDSGVGEAIYEALLAHYSAPSRRYHTPVHIGHSLTQFDEVRELLDDPDAVEMALWFHDVIYSTSAGPGENEHASAEFFKDRAAQDFDQGFVDRVYRLIMVTTHSEMPVDCDECFMVDIDLSSFGLPWKAFSADTRNVRAEFPNLSDAEFYRKQGGFLRSLLSREHFCFSDFFRRRHEAQARANIEKLLEQIAAEGL